MAYELIITEKPSSAKKIADALADSKPVKKDVNKVPYYMISHNKKDIVVACAVGHLYTVAEKEKSFKYPSYDIEWKPAADVVKGSEFSKKYLNAIKKLTKEANSFMVACDYDIEGEVIGLNIIKYICKQKDAKRMKFSTLTKDELVESYEKAGNSLDWGQANAGETRHFLDWMYGINLSRALTLAVKAAGSFKVLSTGRVQGPALKIIVDKELEISKFIPVPYWQLQLLSEKTGRELEFNHVEDKFWDKEKAQEIYNKCKDKNSKITEIESKQFKQKPPTPFDLGALQKESYKLFGISPKHTLDIAQSLYTDGYTSYPRTSSQKLPKELNFKKILGLLAKNEHYTPLANFVLTKTKLIPKEGKKSDPAHPAIYPTGLEPKKLEEREAKVYDLIVKRFFSVFGEDAVRETQTVVAEIEEEKFKTSGTKTIEKNWHELYAPYVKLSEEELPPLEKNEELKTKEFNLLDKETSPPKRYTPASIISELEKRGLGTKATRADIVENLFNRGYVVDKSIQATNLGIKTIQILGGNVPEIVDEKLTRNFEEEMEKIRENKMKPDQVLDGAKKILDTILEKFKKQEIEIGKDLIESLRESQDIANTIGKCPKCKDGTLKITFSKKTRKRFVACDKYPDCETTYMIPQTALIKTSNNLCEKCNVPKITIIMKRRKPQVQCLNSECPDKEDAEVTDAKKKFIEENVNKPCEKCGKDMVERKSFYGSFLGCSGFPKCRNIIAYKDPNKITTVKKKVTKKKTTKKTTKKKKKTS